VLPSDWEETIPSSPEKEKPDGQKAGIDKSSLMFYDILKTKNKALVKASEGNDEDFAKILQEPLGILIVKQTRTLSYFKFLALHMSKSEFSYLKTLISGFRKSAERKNKEVCANLL